VGEGAAEEGDVLQAGKADVPDELAMAREVTGVFLTANSGADAGGRVHAG